ncbi:MULTISPECIES: thioredoxin [Thioalkalivibrio]|uniref:Thioredoxin n=1 Tax=Thioalkalivibrio halophilus TaxID=252474 RepID=A0A1V2ZXW8_9GAMM|nr:MULTISPECIES: thioredoxin [Thioalkalivibrio]OOC09960.1 thioredoxin [Thioalkalivibrio halophilus]PYG04412.1 thioredoxin [Thioalkalivibrio sp. ALE21]
MTEAENATGDAILDVTRDSFQQAVLDESHRRPVLVDFWAAWCGPCKQLMPLLQKIAEDYGGAFRLAKVNSDENQELAGQYGVRSLPTIMCFRHGEVVDQQMGVQPESTIREMIDRHVERPSDAHRQQALAALQAGDAAGAVRALEEAVAVDPGNKDLRSELARAQIRAGDTAAARTTLETALEAFPEDPDLRIELARALSQAGDPDTAEAQLNQLPLNRAEDDAVKTLRAHLRFSRRAAGADPQALTQEMQQGDPAPETLETLAAYSMLHGRYEEALGLYLELMKQHPDYKDNEGDNAGKKGLLAAFNALGNDNPLVSQYRRKMMAAMY